MLIGANLVNKMANCTNQFWLIEGEEGGRIRVSLDRLLDTTPLSMASVVKRFSKWG